MFAPVLVTWLEISDLLVLGVSVVVNVYAKGLVNNYPLGVCEIKPVCAPIKTLYYAKHSLTLCSIP